MILTCFSLDINFTIFDPSYTSRDDVGCNSLYNNISVQFYCYFEVFCRKRIFFSSFYFLYSLYTCFIPSFRAIIIPVSALLSVKGDFTCVDVPPSHVRARGTCHTSQRLPQSTLSDICLLSQLVLSV